MGEQRTDIPQEVSRMSRKEINAEVNHLMREQQEYAEEIAVYKQELERLAGIINGIYKVVDSIREDDFSWFGKVQEIHWLLLEACGNGLHASDYAKLDEIARDTTSMVGYVEIGGKYLRKQDVKGKTEQQINDMLKERLIIDTHIEHLIQHAIDGDEHAVDIESDPIKRAYYKGRMESLEWVLKEWGQRR
jgi:hypothetical protein